MAIRHPLKCSRAQAAHLSRIEIAYDSSGSFRLRILQLHRHNGRVSCQPLLLLVSVASTAEQDDQSVRADSLHLSAPATASHELQICRTVVIVETFKVLDQVLTKAFSHNVVAAVSKLYGCWWVLIGVL